MASISSKITFLMLSFAVFLDIASSLNLVPPTSDQPPLEDEIKCYSIPYGAIGFAQHISTYYKMLVLYRLRQPLMPWRKLKGEKYKVWNYLLSTTQIAVNCVISGVTIHRCNKSWQLILMVVWKWLLAITLACWTFSANRQALSWSKVRQMGQDISRSLGRDRGRYSYVSNDTEFDYLATRYEPYRHQSDSYDADRGDKDQADKKPRVPAAWLLLYLVALCVGLPGLFTLVRQHYEIHLVRIITIIFCSVVGGSAGVVLIVLALAVCCSNEGRSTGLGGSILLAGVFFTCFTMVAGALYSDWVLGAMVNNLIGTPVGTLTSALYWMYFAAKELPMFVQ